MKIKSYKTLSYPYLLTYFTVGGKEVAVVFNGTATRQGTFETSDPELQKAIEESADFNIHYKLDWEADLEDTQTLPQEPQSTTPVDDRDTVTGVNNYHSAKKYLIEHRGINPDEIKNKTELLAKCESLKIKFSDWK